MSISTALQITKKPAQFAGKLVLTAGLEPARLAAGDFKSPVSAIPPCQQNTNKNIIACVAGKVNAALTKAKASGLKPDALKGVNYKRIPRSMRRT